MSDTQADGSALALTLIAFVGSVFSPYYAWSRRRHGDSAADPQRHCAINLSLYRRRAGATRYQRLWAMTERGADQLRRSADQLAIGASRLTWTSNGLQVDIDEWTAPWPRRLRGHIELTPQVLPARSFALDPAGRHHWQPISPAARVDVVFESPRLHWQGDAYLDGNHGTRPLERDFDEWHWSRERLPDDGSRILYDVRGSDAAADAVELRFAADGSIDSRPAPPVQALPRTAWGIQRVTRAEAGAESSLLATLESGPFYSRSLLRNQHPGSHAVHESLSLRRFAAPWVQAMLPFRMPRRA